LRTIPKKEEATLETKEEDKEREAKAILEDDKIKEAKREVVLLPRILLAT